MNTQWITTLALSCAATLVFSARLHSQGPSAEKSPLQTAYGMKAKNQEIIEKQTQTLLKLDELDKAAAQLKAFGKRT